MKRIFLSLTLSALVWAPPAIAGDFDPIDFPSKDGAVIFSMPSGNRECNFTPAHYRGVYRTPDDLAELSCDRAQPSYIRIVLGEKLKPVLIKNPGDQPCCSGNNVIPYGRSWRQGTFECDSRADGLYCTREDQHGFRVSKAKVELF